MEVTMRARTLALAAAAMLVSGSAAADIDIHREHRFDARPGATLLIDVSFHEVEVTARPGATVDVTADIAIKGGGGSAKELASQLEPQFIDEGERLIVRSTRSKGWSWRSLSAQGRVVVSMPPGLDLKIDSSSGGARVLGNLGDSVVRFDASSGSLNLVGAARELHCDASSGSIRVDASRPFEVFTAGASSGSVRLAGGAREVEVETSSGGITLEGLLGDAELEASSGSISAQWDAIAAGATVRADASSGGVSLRFPTGTVLDGEVAVSSGSIRSDFPGTMTKDHLTLAGGADAVDVRVETSSGSVKLLAR
jgi:hypothetical protein